MRFRFGDCVLDPTRRELTRGGETVHVEPQVFDLLVHLVGNRDPCDQQAGNTDRRLGRRIVSESTLSSQINAARRGTAACSLRPEWQATELNAHEQMRVNSSGLRWGYAVTGRASAAEFRAAPVRRADCCR